MFPRTLQPTLRKVVGRYPVVTLTGPRQSGKTTLLRTTFPDYRFVSLDDPDKRAFAAEDPVGFLAQFPQPVILDEVQRAPELLPYIEARVNQDPTPGEFILSGSQNSLHLRALGKLLASRCAVLYLLPLSLSELAGCDPLEVAEVGLHLPAFDPRGPRSMAETLFAGFYPRVHDRNLEPSEWQRNYYQTYVESDLRHILKPEEIESFGRFARLCAVRNGQPMDLRALSADCGIPLDTANRWMGALESTFMVILLRLQPDKRTVQPGSVPKVYFIDTGLLCHLLRIGSPEELEKHPSQPAVMESMAVMELMKSFYHRGMEPDLSLWRKSDGGGANIIMN